MDITSPPSRTLTHVSQRPRTNRTTEKHRLPKMENPVEPTRTVKLGHNPNPVPASSAQVNSSCVALFPLTTLGMFVKVSTTPRPVRHRTTLRPPRSRRPVHPGSPQLFQTSNPGLHFCLLDSWALRNNQRDPSRRFPSPNIAASRSLSPTDLVIGAPIPPSFRSAHPATQAAPHPCAPVPVLASQPPDDFPPVSPCPRLEAATSPSQVSDPHEGCQIRGLAGRPVFAPSPSTGQAKFLSCPFPPPRLRLLCPPRHRSSPVSRLHSRQLPGDRPTSQAVPVARPPMWSHLDRGPPFQHVQVTRHFIPAQDRVTRC